MRKGSEKGESRRWQCLDILGRTHFFERCIHGWGEAIMKTGVLTLQDGHEYTQSLAYLGRLSGQYIFTRANIHGFMEYGVRGRQKNILMLCKSRSHPRKVIQHQRDNPVYLLMRHPSIHLGLKLLRCLQLKKYLPTFLESHLHREDLPS